MISSERYKLVDGSMINEVKYRIAVINYSGNTGKSLASNYLLRPHMISQDHYVISDMSIYNKTYSDEILLLSRNSDEVLKSLNNLDSAIVDIAAHTTDCVLSIMQNSFDSHKVFDYFLVPVVKGRQELEDSLNTIKALLKLGVASNSIKVVFNNIDNENNINYLENIDNDFEYLLSHLNELNISYDTSAVIEHNPLYSRLAELDMNLSDLLSIPVDEKMDRKEHLRVKDSAERTEEEFEELKMLASLITTWRCAQSAVRNLNNVHSLLFAKL